MMVLTIAWASVCASASIEASIGTVLFRSRSIGPPAVPAVDPL
jgi:hypothetical protein